MKTIDEEKQLIADEMQRIEGTFPSYLFYFIKMLQTRRSEKSKCAPILPLRRGTTLAIYNLVLFRLLWQRYWNSGR